MGGPYVFEARGPHDLKGIGEKQLFAIIEEADGVEGPSP